MNKKKWIIFNPAKPIIVRYSGLFMKYILEAGKNTIPIKAKIYGGIVKIVKFRGSDYLIADIPFRPVLIGKIDEKGENKIKISGYTLRYDNTVILRTEALAEMANAESQSVGVFIKENRKKSK